MRIQTLDSLSLKMRQSSMKVTGMRPMPYERRHTRFRRLELQGQGREDRGVWGVEWGMVTRVSRRVGWQLDASAERRRWRHGCRAGAGSSAAMQGLDVFGVPYL